jgi:hypothetical protein
VKIVLCIIFRSNVLFSGKKLYKREKAVRKRNIQSYLYIISYCISFTRRFSEQLVWILKTSSLVWPKFSFDLGR